MQESVFFEENLDESTVLKTDIPQSSSQDYYPLPSSEHLLDQLKKFSHSTQTIGVLIGPRKSGKSTLLTVFKNREQSDGCYLIDTRHSFRPNALQVPGVTTTKGADFATTYEALKAKHDSGMLLVDDAERLTLDLLQMIIESFSNQEDANFKVLLAGDADLLDQIENIREKLPFTFAITSFFVRPLSLQETQTYLSHAFLNSVNKKSKLFSAQTVQKIYQLSGGYPGRISRVASQVTKEGFKKIKPVTKTLSKKKKKSSLVDFLLIAAILVLLLLLGQRFFFANETDEMPAKPVARVALPIKHAISRSAVSDEPSYIASIEDMPEEKILAKKVVPPAAVPANVATKVPHKVMKVVSKAAVAPPVFSHYTVQLMASSNRHALLVWYRGLKSSMPVQTHMVTKDGKSWFVLTSGNYSSKEVAKATLSKLPAKLRVNGAWIRNMVDLK